MQPGEAVRTTCAPTRPKMNSRDRDTRTSHLWSHYPKSNFDVIAVVARFITVLVANAVVDSLAFDDRETITYQHAHKIPYRGRHNTQ